MTCRACVAPALLTHVNLLLAVVGGGAAVTAMRLKWDPSTYVPLRAVFPEEYRVAAALLCGGSVALLLLGHLAAVALALRPAPTRRRLLILYASAMAVLVCVELAVAAWLGTRALAWLRSDQAQDLLLALEMRDHLRPVLDIASKFHPLPKRVNDLIGEAEADVPCNLYAAGAVVVALGALQAVAVVLAALAACAPLSRRARDPLRRNSDSWASAGSDDVTSDKAPLKAVYKNGRLMLV